jgi:Ca2+:H+ antiporter
MMFVATGSLILPTAFEFALPTGKSTENGVLSLSRGTAVILLIIYLSYIFFQLKTHRDYFSAKARGDGHCAPMIEEVVSTESFEEVNSSEIRALASGGSSHLTELTPASIDQGKEVGLGASLTMIILVASATSICSDNLVGSINGVVAASGLSKTFYGLIIIPIVANAGMCIPSLCQWRSEF